MGLELRFQERLGLQRCLVSFSCFWFSFIKDFAFWVIIGSIGVGVPLFYSSLKVLANQSEKNNPEEVPCSFVEQWYLMYILWMTDCSELLPVDPSLSSKLKYFIGNRWKMCFTKLSGTGGSHNNLSNTQKTPAQVYFVFFSLIAQIASRSDACQCNFHYTSIHHGLAVRFSSTHTKLPFESRCDQLGLVCSSYNWQSLAPTCANYRQLKL